MPARAAAARTPHCSPHVPQPPARPTAALVLRSRHSRAPPRTPPTRPACRLRAPQSAARRCHAPRPPARPAAALAPRSSAACSARPPRRTLRGWLPPMPNLTASPTAPPLPSAPSASLARAAGEGLRRRGWARPAGGPRPERCLGTENGSVRRHARGDPPRSSSASLVQSGAAGTPEGLRLGGRPRARGCRTPSGSGQCLDRSGRRLRPRPGPRRLGCLRGCGGRCPCCLGFESRLWWRRVACGGGRKRTSVAGLGVQRRRVYSGARAAAALAGGPCLRTGLACRQATLMGGSLPQDSRLDGP